MAFLDVHPDWNISTGFQLDPTTFRCTYSSKRRFTCEVTDVNNDTPIRARQAGVFPREGDSDPDDLRLICKTVEINRLGLTALECIANYESIPQEIENIGQQPQQVLQGWDVSIDSEDSQEPIDRARDVFPHDDRDTEAINNGVGLATTTICGEAFDPPLTDIVADLALEFSTRNRPFRPELLQMYRNAVNSDTFLGFPAGACRMRQCRGTISVSSDGPPQMQVSCRVVVRSAAPGSTAYRAWWIRVRAEGYYSFDFNSLVAGEPKKLRVLDDYGEPSVKPALHYTKGNNRVGVQIGGSDSHEKAEFYEFQPPSVVYLSFNQFFQAVIAPQT